ncbi:hypothetical protein FNO01nite_20780 [Flavobacterium noncentrifugens]|uniref:Lipase (Class 3) n=1 Tax=Flavobacterium noncentrifugens TaxID=1128970 RepID=A0A1G8YYD4_9FLAO|nr:lipase [Flavobacterium noncentrifugens]GEP51406.1 hypothetical protein FNO01nite_20780 [Flavobacterium noncentrifugens]SDK07796.1 Lipase (class 3) [Flavobacterium noncentrifugens]
MLKKVTLLLIFLLATPTFSQKLKPGFDKQEYIELLEAFSRWGDSVFYKGIPESKIYKTKYRSEEMGLLNQWELYEAPGHSVICIRGTTKDQMSWFANFYAAMIPAQGKLQLNDSTAFDYHFADDPKAAVHVGWTLSTCFLMRDILPKVQQQYEKGVRDFIVFGHSQGAAISYFVTAQLKYYQQTGVLPKDIQFKTYCSAAPKPGNLYFAYDYEASTQIGWSYSVVNASDWVPEVPVSIQQVNDFNTTNPFKDAKKKFKKMPFPQREFMGFMHSQLTKYNRKAVKRYQFFLGKIVSKMIVKKLPGFKNPEYYDSNYYVRTGNMIILKPDEAYFAAFPDNDETLFVHHNLLPYLTLAQKLPN